METAITKITEVDDIGGNTPARVNRETGEMFINRERWRKLPKAHRMFILLHEAGHATLNTKNELLADEYAFNNYADMGYPLSESVKALTRILPFDKPGHRIRAEEQMKRALIFDRYNTGKAKEPVTPKTMYAASMNISGDEFSDLFGRRKLKKQAAENEKKLTEQLNEEKAKAKNATYEKEQVLEGRVQTAEQKKSNTQIYIAAGLLAVIAVVILIFKKKK